MSYRGYIRGNSRVSKEDQEFYDMKNKAAEFYRANGVPKKIEDVLSSIFFDKPDDIYGYLANYFTKLSAPPRISRLKAKEIYDARGQLSIQAEVFCIIKNEEKWICSAAISMDCGVLEEGYAAANNKKRADHVTAALRWINDSLSTMLKGLNPCDQTGIDKILSDFFMARHLEEQDIRKREKEENRPPSEPELQPPPPPPAPTKEKKGGDKRKKSNSVEKPIPPWMPPEPVLPGSLAIGSISLAVAKAGAQLQDIPLFKHIAALRSQESLKEFHIPVTLVTLLSCGKTSLGKLNLLEEVILIPKPGQTVKQVKEVDVLNFSELLQQIVTMALEIQKEMMGIMTAASKAGAAQVTVSDMGALVISYERPEQPLDLITEACSNLGLALGTELHLAVNCAAHELMDYSKGKYDVVTGVLKSPDELVDMYVALIGKYPAVVALIDPLRKEDVEQWERLNSAVGASCSLLSDISSKPPSHSVQAQSPPLPGVRGHILKLTNEMSVSDLICITTEQRGAAIIGTTCGEPCSEDSLSDVAVGLGVSYVKLGGLSGGERLTKYNRLISIEEELAQQGILVSKEKHASPLFVEKPEEQSAIPETVLGDEN